MNRHRVTVALFAGAVLGFSAAVSVGVLAAREPQRPALPAAEARLLTEVLQRVRSDYVRPVDEHELTHLAARGMVSGLDAHSALLDERDFREALVATEGTYVGIGIEVAAADGAIVVIAPIHGSPAARAGLEAGDVLVAVDGHELTGGDMEHAVELLRGEAGTRVQLMVERDGESEPLRLAVTRAQVDLDTVDAALLPGGIAVLRIASFTERTAAQLDAALSRLRREAGAPMRGLVLDLRNNPGGVLEAAVEVADRFLDGGIIVSATGRAPDARFSMSATAGDLLQGAPMAVLVNAGSASAAEIVAGALRDQRRAVLVGRRTFGKGSVQTVMPLSGGEALKLTTSLYFTPSGASIDGHGIEPDIELERATAASPRHGFAPAEDREVQAAARALRHDAHRLARHDGRRAP